jgi:hypothetical protein
VLGSMDAVTPLVKATARDGRCASRRRGRYRHAAATATLALLAIGLTDGLSATGAGAFACANEPAREMSQAQALPDCRSYEMVTPAYSEGYPVFPLAVAPGGDAILASSLGTFAGGEDSQHVGAAYALRRESSEWTATPLTPPASRFALCNSEVLAADTTFGTALFTAHPLGSPFYDQEFLVRAPSGSFTSAGPVFPASATAGPSSNHCTTGEAPFEEGSWTPLATSSDLTHIVYEIIPEENLGILWPGDATSEFAPSLYEYTLGAHSSPRLVGVTGPAGSTSLVSTCGTGLGSGGEHPADKYNAMSQDGVAVFFSAGPCEGGPSTRELYVRLGGDETVPISSPKHPLAQGAGPGPNECDVACASATHQEGMFQGAASDGNTAYFISSQPLLNDDTDLAPDLYRARLNRSGSPAERLRLELVSADPTSGQAAEVQGVVRVSPDGSHVYFVARGVLASNSNGRLAPFDVARLGADNLYVSEPDPRVPGAYRTAFVALLCSNTGKSATYPDSECNASDEELWQERDVRPAQTTADGRFLLFASATDLTAPEDTSTVAQVFRYDAFTGALTRVSIGANGFDRNGNTTREAASIPSPRYADRSALAQPMAISDDGKYVVFTTADKLTAAAPEVESVYEYNAGEVSLISGTGGGELLGADATGSNVFFETSQSLTAEHMGSLPAVYDARVDGGFLRPTTAECSDEGCLPGATPSTADVVPGSASVTGPGNLAPAVAKAPATSKTRSQQLAKALRECRRKHSRAARHGCETRVRKRFRLLRTNKASSGRATR